MVKINPLKRKRQEMGFGKNKMAELLNVSEYTIQDWELCRRNPNLKNVMGIANVYNLSNEDIIEWLKYAEEKSK